MDSILETIKLIVQRTYGKDIDYSKTYKMSCIVFNPATQSITGQSYDDKFNMIVESPLYGFGFTYLFIPPATEYALTFINSDPTQPIAIGLRAMPGIIWSTGTTGSIVELANPSTTPLVPGPKIITSGV